MNLFEKGRERYVKNIIRYMGTYERLAVAALSSKSIHFKSDLEGRY